MLSSICGEAGCNAQAEYVLYVDDRYGPLDVERCSKHISQSDGIHWQHIEVINEAR